METEEARRLVLSCVFFIYGYLIGAFAAYWIVYLLAQLMIQVWEISVTMNRILMCEFQRKISIPRIGGFFNQSYYSIRFLSFCFCLTLPLRKSKSKVRFILHLRLKTKCHVEVAKLFKTEEEIAVNNGVGRESENENINMSQSGKVME